MRMGTFRSDGDFEAVQALANRGFVAFCRGDLPTALTVYDEAADRYALLGVDRTRLAAQFARVCAASPAIEVRCLSYPRALEHLPAVHRALLDDLRHS